MITIAFAAAAVAVTVNSVPRPQRRATDR